MLFGGLGGQTKPIICFIIVALFIGIPFHSTQYTPEYNDTGTLIVEIAPPDTTRAINRTAEIEQILLRLNESVLAKHIQRLQDFKTRYSYRVDKCFQASEYIYSVFERNGLNTTYDPFVYRGWNMRNVIGEKPGTSSSNGTIIICAHYDSFAGTGAYGTAPGADDNGSGTAAVMTAAEVLSDFEFNYTIRFIAFSGEEQGLRGSTHYANNAKTSVENITAVINLDMIAYNPDPGNSLIVVHRNTSPDAIDLANFTDQTAQKYKHISYLDVNIDAVTGNSDHAPFGPQYKGIQLFEYLFNPFYHSTTDTINALNMTYCTNVSQISIATIAELAELNAADGMPPAHTPGIPPPNGYGQAIPTISIEITDPTPLNTSSLEMRIDGTPISPTLVQIPLGLNITFEPITPFLDGQTVNVTVKANDTLGYGFNYSWEFEVDAISPSPPTPETISLVRVEMEKRGLVLDKGVIGEEDDVHAYHPSVIYHNNEYKMWYTANNGSRYHICYANSTDGLSWTKHGIALYHGQPFDQDSARASLQSVIFEDDEYKMWYSGYDGLSWKIMYANSTDGLIWAKQGVVIDLGSQGSLDSAGAYSPSVIKTDEYEMWYNGQDGMNVYILYANSSDGINWNKYINPAIVTDPDGKYDNGRVIFPSVYHNSSGYYMWYTGDNGNYRVLYAESSDGLNWHKKGLAIDKGVAGEYDVYHAGHTSCLVKDNETKVWYSGSTGNLRILFANLTLDDNKTDLSVSWFPSSSNDVQYYEILRVNAFPQFTPWPTHVQLRDPVLVENKIGDENATDFFYKIRAVDKVGNTGECDVILGKVGIEVVPGWNLIGNPFLEENASLAKALFSLKWDFARSYDVYDPIEPWKSNFRDRPDTLNTLNQVNQSTGIWAHVNAAEIYATVGVVDNITINLQPGWNLIAYPYFEIKNVSVALSTLPWDNVEGFNASAEYHLINLSATDKMHLGMAYWIHLTSAAVWDAANL
jgi:hypothetical protein